jgi:hypothetical protein
MDRLSQKYIDSKINLAKEKKASNTKPGYYPSMTRLKGSIYTYCCLYLVSPKIKFQEW